MKRVSALWIACMVCFFMVLRFYGFAVLRFCGFTVLRLYGFADKCFPYNRNTERPHKPNGHLSPYKGWRIAWRKVTLCTIKGHPPPRCSFPLTGRSDTDGGEKWHRSNRQRRRANVKTCRKYHIIRHGEDVAKITFFCIQNTAIWAILYELTIFNRHHFLQNNIFS